MHIEDHAFRKYGSQHCHNCATLLKPRNILVGALVRVKRVSNTMHYQIAPPATTLTLQLSRMFRSR
jgi:hypothetical protein